MNERIKELLEEVSSGEMIDDISYRDDSYYSDRYDDRYNDRYDDRYNDYSDGR